MICGSDGILAKPTNDNGKIANGSNNNMFLTLHIRAMARQTIIGRASFSIDHGRKAGIAMLDQMSPTSQGPVACHQSLLKKLGNKWLNYSEKGSA
jgi:hypothetical protein